jgi:prepilin-type N-terminal cleavage/methylation domain-containing protein
MRGFTLVELLVALCIATLAIAGGLSGLSRVLEAWRLTQVNERLHERALYVFATLEPELQMAGFFGSGPAPRWATASPPPASLDSCGPAMTRLDAGVEAHTSAWPLDCAAQGGGAAVGGTVLILRRAAANPGSPEAGRVQLLDSETVPSIRQLRWDGALPSEAAACRDVLWRNLNLRAYYVARAADEDAATPALRVKTLTSVAGRPAFVDTEVMPGVAQFSIELLPSPAAATSAKLTLAVQADAADTRRGKAPARLTVTRHLALRNVRPG